MTTTRATPHDSMAAAAASPVIVRRGRPEDHPAVADLVRTVYAPYRSMLPRRVGASLVADLLDLDRHTSDGHLLVAEADGRILGSGLFYPDSGLQGLGWPRGWAGGRGLAVHPDARARGLATALLAECECLARAAGAPEFAFHTLEVMTAAVSLYEGLGYRRAPEYDADLGSHYAIAGGPQVRALAYRRTLLASAA